MAGNGKSNRDHAAQAASLIVIGDGDNPEFQPLLEAIAAFSNGQAIAEFTTIPEALRSPPDLLPSADLILVLQSWSDQYSLADVSQLIGRTLFSRLLCVYGPWCASDGRTREIWPAALRVSLPTAVPVILAELQDCRAGRAVLPPTASPEEVFSRRSGNFSSESVNPPREFARVLVISDDAVLRDTVASICVARQIQAITCGIPAAGTNRLPVSLTPGERLLLVHDLDGPAEQISRSVSLWRSRVPGATILGMSGEPSQIAGGQHSELEIDGVLPKQDLVTCLNWSLQTV